ncbi:MAG: beta-lactamase family protein [Flavobacteriaceae bacterium]|nr:beta-lactamase family protein [Flavobacteriaceae bacterium]
MKVIHYLSYKVLLIFTVILINSCGQEIKNKTVASVNDQSTVRLDSLFKVAVKNHEIPGAVAYLKKDGKVIFHKAFGFQDVESRIAMSEHTIFRMASMTKGLTAVAILQLYERGLLDLDDDLSKYIPEFNDLKILKEVLPDSSFTSYPAKGRITLHHLLTHTSGIGYGFQNDHYNALIIKNEISEGFCDDQRTSLENTRLIAKIPLLHEPGEKNVYSLSYDILGTVIEIVSGLRFDVYVKKHILDPLEMNDSYFIVPQDQRFRLTKVYQPGTIGNTLIQASYPDVHYPVIDDKQFFSGGADLCGTAADYAKFIEMILNKGTYGKQRIVGKKYIEMMLAKQTKFNDGDADQGYAAWVTNAQGAANGHKSIGSFDFGGFFDTYSWADPSNDLTAILLLQMYPTNNYNIHEKYQKIVYGIFNDN